MKSKKVTMLAAALVVAVVALAGVGYAATNYKATTENANNELKSTYLTIEQTSGAMFDDNFFDKIYFNTETTGLKSGTTWTNVTTYTPVYNYLKATDETTEAVTYTAAETGGNVALVSNVLQLTIKKTNSAQTTADLRVTVSNFDKIANLTYTMVLVQQGATGITVYKTSDYGEQEATQESAGWNGWFFSGVDIGAANSTTPVVYTVYLFISASGDVAQTNSIASAGFNYSGSSTSVKSAFVFEATAQAA